MHNKTYCRTVSFILALGIFLLFEITFNAHADLLGSLNLICRTSDVTLGSMHWDIYRVGERKGNDFVLTGDFAGYSVTFGDFSASDASAAADTLENYAVLDKVSPLDSGETSSDGTLRFNGLESGLYLVCGKTLKIDDIYYVPSAILIEVNINDDDGNQSFDLDAYPKIIYRTLSSEIMQYEVRKIWEYSENTPSDRPVSIAVELYCDGELYNTVILDESNKWEYTWMAESGTEWRVKEASVPENYTVMYRSNETQFAIVNTYDKKTTAETTVSSDSGSVNKQTVVTTVTDSVVSNENRTKLPQTGQLWWPVPIMIFGGLILIVIGIRLNSGIKKDDD